MTKKAKVFIQGRAYNSITADVFNQTGLYEIVNSIEAAQVCCWTGGEDIHPSLYGEKPLPTTYFTGRDVSDLEAVKTAVEQGKFLLGICRGAQLLNCIPNGGKLWQDVNGHENGVHRAFDCVTGKWILVNSVHHQMMRPTDKAEILCWAQEATYKKAATETWQRPPFRTGGVVLEKDKDIEGIFYPETQSLCVQFHPEFRHGPTTEYFHELMAAYYWGRQASVTNHGKTVG